MTDTARPPSFLLRAHAGTVLVLFAIVGVLFALQPPGSPGGVNIGAALASPPILVLGWPWSTLGRMAFDAYGPTRAYAHDPLLVALDLLVALGGAPLDVAIHALVRHGWRRRRGTRPVVTPR